MRRMLVWSAVLLFLLTSLASCTKTVLPPEADYTVETVTEYRSDNGNRLQLMYPAISGHEDKNTEARVNALLAAYAMEMYQREDMLSSAGGGYTYAATEVQITLQTKGFLSGYVGGVISADSTGYRAYFSYTFNCDTEDCVLYSAEELIADYESLAKWFQKGRFTQHFGYPALHEQIALSDMISQYKEEYGIYPCFYFTEDSLGILVEVIPLLDGYAGYTLPVSQAIKTLNKEIPIVKLYLREN